MTSNVSPVSALVNVTFACTTGAAPAVTVPSIQAISSCAQAPTEPSPTSNTKSAPRTAYLFNLAPRLVGSLRSPPDSTANQGEIKSGPRAQQEHVAVRSVLLRDISRP